MRRAAARQCSAHESTRNISNYRSPILAWLALGPPDRETGNRHRLAPQGLSPLLDLEEPTSERPTVCTPRDPRSDPQDESCQSTLGRAPHTRRVAQAGY